MALSKAQNIIYLLQKTQIALLTKKKLLYIVVIYLAYIEPKKYLIYENYP